MNTHTRANIVIVDYNKASHVVQNVREIQEQIDCPDIEVCIEDNSCNRDNAHLLEKLRVFKNVHISINKTNKGYIRSCNDAASRFDSDYIILVNPDISWIEKTTIHDLVTLMDNNSDYGIVGPRQINDDGTTPDIVRSFPNFFVQIARRTPLRKLPIIQKLVNEYVMTNFDYSKSQYVDWIQSSLLIIRRDLWDNNSGLDNSYFLFMSDPDICYQSWKQGYKVYYTAETLVGADGKRCSAGGFKDIFKNKAIQYHLRDAFVYQLKHLFNKNPRRI